VFNQLFLQRVNKKFFIFENKYFILHKEKVADIADKHTPPMARM